MDGIDKVDYAIDVILLVLGAGAGIWMMWLLQSGVRDTLRWKRKS